MDFSVIAGHALDAVSNIGGGLFNMNQAKKNRAFQERMYEKAKQDNIEQWERENAFNLPSAQLQRLLDAGLSPLLMFGNGGAMNVAATPSRLADQPSGSQAQANFHTNFGQAVQQAKLLDAQIGLLESQRDKNEADKDLTESQTTGQDFMNWLNDNTKNVQLALKYRDWDYVNSVIQKNTNEVFQSAFRNGAEMASLSLMNTLAIRRQNLSEYEVGQNILIGWQNVANGKMQAQASLRSAFAALMQAQTAAKIAPAQIGLMRANAANIAEQTRFLKGSYSFRVDQAWAQSRLMRKDLSWYDILRESGVSQQQSQIFLNKMNSYKLENDIEWQPIDKMMTPFNMLTGFGAGLFMGKGSNYMNGYTPSYSGY